jgi:hypothetical protein
VASDPAFLRVAKRLVAERGDEAEVYAQAVLNKAMAEGGVEAYARWVLVLAAIGELRGPGPADAVH